MMVGEPTHRGGNALICQYARFGIGKRGHGCVTVAARRINLNNPATPGAGLKEFNPQRYASLQVADSQTNEIIAQVGRLIRANLSGGPMGNYAVSLLILSGTSDSSAATRAYMSSGTQLDHADVRMPDGGPIHQGFFVTSTLGNAVVPIADVPTIQMPSQSEVHDQSSATQGGVLVGVQYRRPDSDAPGNQFRIYEVAGMSHNDARENPAFEGCTHPLSHFPHGAFTFMGLQHLLDWSAFGTIPPHAPSYMETSAVLAKRHSRRARRARQRQGRRAQHLPRRTGVHLHHTQHRARPVQPDRLDHAVLGRGDEGALQEPRRLREPHPASAEGADGRRLLPARIRRRVPARRHQARQLRRETMTRFTRRRFIQGAAAMAAGGTMTGQAPAHDDERASCEGARDLHLVNGRFLTMDPRRPVVSALAIRAGRVAALGHADELGPCARTINLRGATAIPGLMDSHVHFIRCGQNPGHEVRIIETAASIAELTQMIGARIKELAVPAGEFITCVGGWNINGLAEKRLPTVDELDKAAPNHPVYLSTTGAGGAVTNTPGRAFFVSRGLTVNANGTLNAGQGLAALQAVQTEEDRQRGTAEAIDFAASLGLTCVTDMGVAGAAVAGIPGFKYALNLWRDDNLKLRIRLYFNSSTDPGFTEAEAKIIHSLNQVGDDVFRPLGVGERTNASTTNLQFPDFLKFAAQNGWTVTQHSLTSSEIDFHIASYQAVVAAQAGPIEKLRWGLDHVNPISPIQIAAVKALGIVLRLQGWNYTSANPAGPPWRSLVDSGIRLAAGTDSTNVGPLNPWLMMSYMTTMKNNAGVDATPANQQITREEALRLYTADSAYVSFDEEKLGSLEVGKLADVAVLSDDPLTVPPDRLRRIRSTLTLQAGRIVHGGDDEGRHGRRGRD